MRTLSGLLMAFVLAFAATANDDNQIGADAVAGLEMKNARLVDGALLTGGQPTKKDLGMLKAKGVTTVINLRHPDETMKHPDAAVPARFRFKEKEAVDALGLAYFNVPISTAADLTEETARLLDEALAATDGPVLLHCGSGNRVGALMALRAYHVQGKSPDEALEEGRKAGLTKLEPKVKALLGMKD